MGKRKKASWKPDSSLKTSQEGAHHMATKSIAGSAPDEDIESLTGKERKAYENLVREQSLLENERQNLQNMAERGSAERALLNENEGNIDGAFSMTAKGDYVYGGKRFCCLETGFQQQCTAGSPEDVPCKHELCSRAKTQGVSWMEFDTLKYYELRINTEKSTRMKSALRKQREVELARVKKLEDDDRAKRARKPSLVDEKERRARTSALDSAEGALHIHGSAGEEEEEEEEEEEDLATTIFGLRTVMMQSLKRNATLTGAGQVSYDLSSIREEAENLQRRWRDSKMNWTLARRLQQPQTRLKETESRSNWLVSAKVELERSKSLTEQTRLEEATEKKSVPPHGAFAMEVLREELGFSTNATMEQMQSTVKASISMFSGNNSVPKTLLNTLKALENEASQFQKQKRQMENKKTDEMSCNRETSDVFALEMPGPTKALEHLLCDGNVLTPPAHEKGLQVEDNARREMQQEWDRLGDAAPETLLASLNKIKDTAVATAPVPRLTEIVLDVVVSTVLDVHKANSMLKNIEKLSDNDIVGQITSTVLARAEKNPLWYMNAMKTIEMSFEATTVPIPERVKIALQRVRNVMWNRAGSIKQKQDSSPSRIESESQAASVVSHKAPGKASDDLKSGSAHPSQKIEGASNRFTELPISQIIALEQKLLVAAGGYEVMATYMILLFCNGYSPGCATVRIARLFARLANRDASRIDNELHHLAQVVVDCTKPLPAHLNIPKADFIPWQAIFKSLVDVMLDVYKTLECCLQGLWEPNLLQNATFIIAAEIMSALVLSPALGHIEQNLRAISSRIRQKYGKFHGLEALILRLVRTAGSPEYLCNAYETCCKVHTEEQTVFSPLFAPEITTETVAIEQALSSFDNPRPKSNHCPVSAKPDIKEDDNVEQKPVELSVKIAPGPARRILLPRGQRKQSHVEMGVAMMKLSDMGKRTASKILDFGRLQIQAYERAEMQVPGEIEGAMCYARFLLSEGASNLSTTSLDDEAEYSDEDEDCSDPDDPDYCCPTCGTSHPAIPTSDGRVSKFAEDFPEGSKKVQKCVTTPGKLVRRTKERLQGIVDGKASLDYCCWVAYKLRAQAKDNPLDGLAPFRNFETLIYRVGGIPYTLRLVLDYASRGLSGLREISLSRCKRDSVTTTVVHEILKKIQRNEVSFDGDDESWLATEAASLVTSNAAEVEKISVEAEFSDEFFQNEIVLYNFLETIRADYKKRGDRGAEGFDVLIYNIQGLARKERFDQCRDCLSDLIKMTNTAKSSPHDDAWEQRDMDISSAGVKRGNFGGPPSSDSGPAVAVKRFCHAIPEVNQHLEAALTAFGRSGSSENEHLSAMIGLVKSLGFGGNFEESNRLKYLVGAAPQVAAAGVDVTLVPEPLNVNHAPADHNDQLESTEKNLMRRNDFLGVFEKFMASAQATTDSVEQTLEEFAYIDTFRDVAEKLEFVLGNVLEITAQLAEERGWHDIADDIQEALAAEDSERTEMPEVVAGGSG